MKILWLASDHFRPTFKLLRRDKRGSRTVRIYEPQPKTPYQRLRESPNVSEASKQRLQAEHSGLDPFTLKKGIEEKLRKFFTVLGNRDRESTMA